MHEQFEKAWSYLLGIWQYRWYVLGFAWLIALAAWTLACVMPDQYRASARIQVDTESVLQPLLKGLAVQPDTQRQLYLLSRTLLSRPNLEKVAHATGLDRSLQTQRERDVLIDQFERRVNLSISDSANLYRVTYENTDPQTAQAVVKAVVDLFLERNAVHSREDSESAREFLDRKIKEYESRLNTAEQRLMEFKRAHAGEMPGASGDYFARLQEATKNLESARYELQTARSRRDELKKQLVGEEPMFGIMSPDTRSQLTPELDQRISTLQDRLDQLRLKYTDKHPEVVSLRATIARLEADRKMRQAELASQVTPRSSPALEQNPVYQQIKSLLAQSEADVAAAGVKVRQYEQQVSELKRKVDVIPEVEAQLKQLSRDYETNKETYDSLLKRRDSAQISDEAKASGSEVTFRVVEPARVDSEPVAPNRPLLVTVGFAAAVGGWGGLGLLLVLARPAFFTRAALYEATGVPVLGAIGRVYTGPQRVRHRLEIFVYALVCGLLVLTYLAVMAVSLLGWI